MIISTSNFGRLGNRLQLSAFVLAYAISEDRRATLLGLGKYAHYFVGPSNSWFHTYPPISTTAVPSSIHPRIHQLLRRSLRRLGDIEFIHRVKCSKGYFQDLEPMTLPQSGPIHLDGHYFSAAECLGKHSNFVRRFLRPLPEYRSSVDISFENYRKKFDRIVGLHIRHGDFRTWESGRHFFEIDTYVDAVRKNILDSNSKTLIVAVSNTKLPDGIFPETPCVRGPGTEIGDLYALSKCDVIVGPFSTFNLWGSFFGRVPRYEMRRMESGPEAVPVGVSRNLDEAVRYSRQDE
ncbi:hypothetical protein GGQ21_003094 [Salinibacter ruber]|nr:hypothetical protein [Salinibacter ruber]